MMKRKTAMMDRYDKFVATMADRYAEARACLDRDDYVGAHQILARMAVSHAKTAISLRSAVTKMSEDT
jgi:hypothetical protein